MMVAAGTGVNLHSWAYVGHGVKDFPHPIAALIFDAGLKMLSPFSTRQACMADKVGFSARVVFSMRTSKSRPDTYICNINLMGMVQWTCCANASRKGLQAAEGNCNTSCEFVAPNTMRANTPVEGSCLSTSSIHLEDSRAWRRLRNHNGRCKTFEKKHQSKVGQDSFPMQKKTSQWLTIAGGAVDVLDSSLPNS